MSSILFEIKDSIGFITLNRPDKFNSFNREMSLLLQSKLDECASLHEIRCVYITGAGKAFSAGQDIGELVGENAIGIDKILSEHFNPAVAFFYFQYFYAQPLTEKIIVHHMADNIFGQFIFIG